MATFSGGEEITGVFSIRTTYSGTGPTVYTVPAGKYARVQIAEFTTTEPTRSLNINLPTGGGFGVTATSSTPVQLLDGVDTGRGFVIPAGTTITIQGGAGSGSASIIVEEYNNP